MATERRLGKLVGTFRWKRAAVLALVAVLAYGIYLGVSTFQDNGRRLDKALAGLGHSNSTNDSLVQVIRTQSGQIADLTHQDKALRRALIKAGVPRKTVKHIGQVTVVPGPTGPTGPTGPPGPTSHPSAHPSTHPSTHPSRPPTHPSKPPKSPKPTPQPTCRVVNPLTGKCLVRVDLPVLGNAALYAVRVFYPI